MSASLHARAARFLLASWDVLRPDEREDARGIVERALRMNPGDGDLLEQGRAKGAAEDRG
jgi:hypothetical protein